MPIPSTVSLKWISAWSSIRLRENNYLGTGSAALGFVAATTQQTWMSRRIPAPNTQFFENIYLKMAKKKLCLPGLALINFADEACSSLPPPMICVCHHTSNVWWIYVVGKCQMCQRYSWGWTKNRQEFFHLVSYFLSWVLWWYLKHRLGH